MKELTEKQYWDSMYESEFPDSVFQPERLADEGRPLQRHPKNLIKALLGKKMLEYMQSYHEYLCWNVIYKKYMPKAKQARVLEVGSAPGLHLVKLNHVYGFVPYGVEYSETGLGLNRKLFISHNLNPENVIHADFLSDEFHDKYKGCFDVVVSRGFVEHFTEVEPVIDKHISLLAQGGRIFVSVPNLTGVNYLLAWLFNRNSLSLHNTKIMPKRDFLKLFDNDRLLCLFCDYFGTFDFGVFDASRNSPMRVVLSWCYKIQLIFNLVFRLLLKEKGAESRLFSPHLIYVGIKKQ